MAWQVPVIFVCENNQYAEFTPSEDAWHGPDLVTRARGYGLRAASIDGNDVEAVETAAREAVGLARRGGGASFLEMRTYRIGGHYEGDAARYRRAGELEPWQARDPIAGARGRLEGTGLEARADALAAPFPDPASVLEAVGG